MSELESVRGGCQGEPYHTDFFDKTVYHYDSSVYYYWYIGVHYVKRHNVLFNLYSFDSLSSNRTHAPTLNLHNCDFKYFLDK